MPKSGPGKQSEKRLKDAGQGESQPKSAVKSKSKSASTENISRWRKIEIMRERAALREALGEDESDLDALDVEVFGTEEENSRLYRHDDSDDEDDEDDDDGSEDDGYEDEDFDDFEED